MVREDELFYWSRRWQDDEATTRDELARGDARRFSSARDAVRALYEVDDDAGDAE